MTTNIYKIVNLSDQYNEPAYAIVHEHFGTVSVWDSLEFAESLYEDLELGIADVTAFSESTIGKFFRTT